MPQHVNHNAPKKQPWVSMVSETWGAKPENSDFPMTIDPSTFTVFHLVIENSDLDQEGREFAYLADDEGEDD